MTIPQTLPGPLQDFDQNPTIPIPDIHIMRRLVRRAAHDVLCIARKADRVPRGAIDGILESERRGQGAGQWGAREEAEGAVGGACYQVPGGQSDR